MVNNCFSLLYAVNNDIWFVFYRCGRGLFQKCVSIVKKQAGKVVPDDYKLLTYLIFDAPTHGGKYEDRVKWLQANIPQDDDKCFATVVGIKKCEGLAQLKQFLADVNKAGGEGIMLRKPGSLYEHKRSTTLLKVKTFYDEGKLSIISMICFIFMIDF
jgi:DNA ligase-1